MFTGVSGQKGTTPASYQGQGSELLSPATRVKQEFVNGLNALQSKVTFSLFFLLSSLEKVAEGTKRRVKSEKNKKKKPLARLFLFGGGGGIRTHESFRPT